MTLTEHQLERYRRQIVLDGIGLEGQDRLRKSRVLIIGAGGLGSPAALYLCAAGVGTIGIADGDRVALSNLNRQILHSSEDLGMAKTESAKRALERLNPDTNVLLYGYAVGAGDISMLLKEYDFVIDATDNLPSKFLINDACVLEKTP